MLFAYLEASYPKGIDNPFNTSGCEYLLFVCRCLLRGGLITEENTYRRYTASSLPLWGNTDKVLVDIKRNFWRRCRGGSSTSTRFLITNRISLQFTLFAICLSFSSPPLHKNLPFYSPSFSFAIFLVRSVLCAILFATFVAMDSSSSIVCTPENEVLNFKQRGGENIKDAWYTICNAHNRSIRKQPLCFYVGFMLASPLGIDSPLIRLPVEIS